MTIWCKYKDNNNTEFTSRYEMPPNMWGETD